MNKGGGTVHAFEPVPAMFNLLKRNIELNGLNNVVECHQCALGEVAESRVIHISDTNFGDNRIKAGDSNEPTNSENSVPTICRRLDDVLIDSDLSKSTIKLLKVDCQGWEVAVLRGAKNTLSRTQFLLIEFEPSLLNDAGMSASDYASEIRDHFSSFAKIPADVFQPLIYLPIAQLDQILGEPLPPFGTLNMLFRK